MELIKKFISDAQYINRMFLNYFRQMLLRYWQGILRNYPDKAYSCHNDKKKAYFFQRKMKVSNLIDNH